MDEQNVKIIDAATLIIDSGHKHRTDAIALYVFFQILANINEDAVEKGKITAHTLDSAVFLGWTKQRYVRAKKVLLGLDMIEDVIGKDKSGRYSGRHIQIK